MTIFGDDLEPWKIVALTDFKIVKIVGWSNLDRAGAVFWVGVLISNNRDFSVCKWQVDGLADKIFVTLVLGVDCNSSIAE